jgi:hypothetical protein
MLGLLLLTALQMTNNMIFDPIFEHKQRNSAQGSEEAAASCRLSRKTSLTARTGQKAV